jgi:hypothetical protein
MKSNCVVVRALVDDVIFLGLEPNKSDSTVLALQQGERHELAKVRRGPARHAAVMLPDVRRGTGGRRLGRQLAFELLLRRKLRRRPRHTGATLQASSRTSHRQAVKHIFRYLRYTPELGLWYSASSSLSLLGFLDANFEGCRVDRKSTSGTCQFLGSSLVS